MPDLCMLPSEGLSDLALDCGHLPSVRLDEGSSEVLLSFPWPPGAGQPHKLPYCAEVRRAGAGASGPGRGPPSPRTEQLDHNKLLKPAHGKPGTDTGY